MSIANCGHDENGRYTGGQAGDQTGTEWHVINWYNYPWNCVLRHPDEKVRKKMAELAKAGALNNNIGYDQYQRLTFWNELKKVNYNPANIKVKCEADCSSGVCSIVKAVGYLFDIAKLKNIDITTTHYMRNMLKNAGFEVLTASKYLTSDAYLVAGDILLSDMHHTTINLTDGSKAEKPKCICKFVKANATMTKNTKVYHTNSTKQKTGEVYKDERVEVLKKGKSWSIIHYGVDEDTDAVGFVPKSSITMD